MTAKVNTTLTTLHRLRACGDSCDEDGGMENSNGM
jgi:hypothetical protein